MKPCWSLDPNNRPDFSLLKERFNKIRGRARDFILLDKQEGKKLSRSSASSVPIEKQHSQISTSTFASECLDLTTELTAMQIYATRNFDPLNANYSFVPRDQPLYENQDPSVRPDQPNSMHSKSRGNSSASVTNIHYSGASLNGPTRTSMPCAARGSTV